MINYISINIIYLVHKSRLGQDEFGAMFNLNKGLIGKYVNKISLPKIETIQRICLHFEITIDDFVNKELEKAAKPYGIKKGELLYTNEPEPGTTFISPRYVETLEKLITDKDKIITLLEEKLQKEIPSDKTRDGLKIIDEMERLSREKSIK